MKHYRYILPLIFSSTVMASEKLPVYPSKLEKLASQEIGIVIKSFIPNVNQKNIGFEYKSNDKNVVWLTRPYIETQLADGSYATLRKGIFRSHVGNVKTTFLSDRKYELSWSVVYRGNLAKFGVNEISFYPNQPDTSQYIIDSSQCLGANYNNCDFNPLPSLKKLGVTSQAICKEDLGGGNIIQVYLLKAPNKQPTYAIYRSDVGSAGKQNQFDLIFNITKNTICNSIRF